MTTREALAWLAYHSLYAFIMFKWNGTERFDPPEEMEGMKTEFCLQDSLTEYLYAMCDTLDNETLRDWLEGKNTADLYEDYREFVTTSGRSLPVMRNTFRSKLCTEYRLNTKRRSIRDGVKVTSIMVFEKLPDPAIEKLCRDPDAEEKAEPAEDIISDGTDTSAGDRE